MKRRVTYDHIDRNGLNNQKSNFRECTLQQNQFNSTKRKGTISPYKGVSRKKRSKRWYAQIRFNVEQLHIGYFDTQESAAVAYDRKATELFGEFAVLNFPVLRSWESVFV